jgi:ferric-dicitrate binding protein FerR (iron transport regulator)
MEKMNSYQLCRFFSREATMEEEKVVLDWVEENAANQQEFLSERRLYDRVLLHGGGDECPFEACSGARRRVRLLGWAKKVMRIAAVVLLLLGLSHYHRSRQEKRMPVNTVTVPPGQRVNLELPDGTKVCMNARSELKYPAIFADGHRKVTLKGEAFFEVAHEQAKPFIVETELCDVEVLGTIFNVQAYPGSGETSTILLEGQVRLTDRHTHRQVLLSPRQEAGFTPKTGFRVSGISDPDHLRWREGLICFQNLSLNRLIREFERYYAVKIRLERTQIGGHELSGKLKISDGIDHALRVLQKSIPFTYTRDKRDEQMIYIQ